MAYLTSDFHVNAGGMEYKLKPGSSELTISSTSLIDFSYNLNQDNLDMSFFLNFAETVSSSQGPLAYTHLATGLRYYPLGINGQRVIYDSTTEGRLLKPSPFVSVAFGVSNFSVKDINSTEGYFNAVGYDVLVAGGVEVVLTSDIFLTGQLVIVQGIPTTNPQTQLSLSYSGMALLFGLKLTSF